MSVSVRVSSDSAGEPRLCKASEKLVARCCTALAAPLSRCRCRPRGVPPQGLVRTCLCPVQYVQEDRPKPGDGDDGCWPGPVTVGPFFAGWPGWHAHTEQSSHQHQHQLQQPSPFLSSPPHHGKFLLTKRH